MAIIRVFRDRLLSLWQSSVADVFEAHGHADHESMRATADYGEALANRPAWMGVEDILQNLSHDNYPAFVSGVHHQLAIARVSEDGRFFEHLIGLARDAAFSLFGKRFEEGHDPRWGRCIQVYREYHRNINEPERYRHGSVDGEVRGDFSVIDPAFGRSARIGLVGDWGTGEPEALGVFRAMVAEKPDLIIHLGDIYYSGTPAECERHFKDVIRSQIGYGGPVFILAGNHDYYAAGAGYFSLLDTLNPGRPQEASFFCLRNDHWQLLGMDTGYYDSVPMQAQVGRAIHASIATHLRQSEVDWLAYQLKSAGDRSTILLSHHQLFSAYDQIGIVRRGESLNDELWMTFRKYMSGRHGSSSRVRAWFWGHEHDYMTFDRDYKELNLGVCIGHGGIPVRVADHPKPLPAPYGGLSQLSQHELGADETHYRHGFSLLDLDKQIAQLHTFELLNGQLHRIGHAVV